MSTAESLKAEITSSLDGLSVPSLETLAEFAAFLRSKGRPDAENGKGKVGAMEARGEREAVERYAAAYSEYPETDEEVAITYAMSQTALAGEPWE